MGPRLREYDEAHTERVLLNLSWLIKLRWAAVAGQLVAVLVAWRVFDVHLRLGSLFFVIGIAAFTNLMLQAWFRSRIRGLGESRDHQAEDCKTRSHLGHRGEALILGLMVLDMLLLTALLYFTGGPSNPFVLFYLVNILLVAVLVRPLWSAVLTILAFLCYGFLFVQHQPLAVLEVGPGGERSGLHLGALLAAFLTAAGTLLYFFLRVTLELDRFEKALARSREAQERSAKLTAMATLAAGAAHELSSPLSTIAIVSKELLRSLESHDASEEELEDALLIRQEVQRCRSILDQMAHDAGEITGEAFETFGLRELVDTVLDGLREAERVHVHLEAEILTARLHLPKKAVARALRGILKNALDASAEGEGVQFALRRGEGRLELLVRDEGTGMSPEVLAQAENPFFTTKEAGQGMGLGLLLTRNVLERLGGTMELESEAGVGTSVHLTLPLASEDPSGAVSAGTDVRPFSP